MILTTSLLYVTFVPLTLLSIVSGSIVPQSTNQLSNQTEPTNKTKESEIILDEWNMETKSKEQMIQQLIDSVPSYRKITIKNLSIEDKDLIQIKQLLHFQLISVCIDSCSFQTSNSSITQLFLNSLTNLTEFQF